MSRFAILLGGAVTRTAELEAEIAGSRVIAADSGMRHAGVLNVVPELWVGDFDSVSEALRQANPGVPGQVFPREKDNTDGELAVEAALSRGASSLLLVGAFGGSRQDHVLLHLTQAIHHAERGIPTVLTSGLEVGHPLPRGKALSVDYPDGTLFSILPFSDLTGLAVEGAKWPLDAVTVPFGSSLTMSNVVEGDLKIMLEQGRALVLFTVNAANQED